MGVQGKKIRITHCYILFLGEKKVVEYFQLGYSQKGILYNLWMNDGIKIRYVFWLKLNLFSYYVFSFFHNGLFH